MPRLSNTIGHPRLINKQFQIQQPTRTEAAQHIYEDGKKLTLDKLLLKDEVWQQSLSNELGRVMQGVGSRIVGTDTMEFISKDKIPYNKKVTYANFVCDHRPLKEEKYRVRMTIGGDKLEYQHETPSPTASLIETKLLLNSVI